MTPFEFFSALVRLRITTAAGFLAVYATSSGAWAAEAVLSRGEMPADDLHLAHRLAIGLGSVVLIGVVGWSVIALSRKFNWQIGGGNAVLRIVASRRLSTRLHVVALEAAPGRIIVFADNGRSIEKLAEYAASSTSEAGKANSDA